MFRYRRYFFSFHISCSLEWVDKKLSIQAYLQATKACKYAIWWFPWQLGGFHSLTKSTDIFFSCVCACSLEILQAESLLMGGTQMFDFELYFPTISLLPVPLLSIWGLWKLRTVCCACYHVQSGLWQADNARACITRRIHWHCALFLSVTLT